MSLRGGLQGAVAARFLKNIAENDVHHPQPTLNMFKNNFDLCDNLEEKTKEEFSDLLLNDVLALFLAEQAKSPGDEENCYHRSFQEMIRQ